MSIGAIIAISILATAVLLMRFPKRWLAKFNIVVTNRITGLFAGSSPIVVHDSTRSRFPIPVRLVLRLVGAGEYIQLST